MKNLISLDSLTDIVSNSVGILIIFAVINLIHDNNKTYQLEIPIEHRTELSPAFFMIKNDSILEMDIDTLFSNATLQATRGAAKRERIFSLDYFDVLGKINEDDGISFFARDTAKWPKFQELGKGNSKLTTALNKLDSKKQFAFFFVYDSSDDDDSPGSGFEAFREAREYLKARRIKTGWRPVNDDAPANICKDHFGKRCDFLPSYLGDIR
ncbi:MAG: hypothetical protein ACI88H_001696 [Cocleimonas sp.]|jgi:hypothetical protein